MLTNYYQNPIWKSWKKSKEKRKKTIIKKPWLFQAQVIQIFDLWRNTSAGTVKAPVSIKWFHDFLYLEYYLRNISCSIPFRKNIHINVNTVTIQTAFLEHTYWALRIFYLTRHNYVCQFQTDYSQKKREEAYVNRLLASIVMFNKNVLRFQIHCIKVKVGVK